MVDPIVTRPMNRIRADLGLPPIKHLFKDAIHSPGLTIGLFPDWYAPPQPDWPSQVRLTGFPLFDEADVGGLPAEVERFLAAGDAPVAFTPGSAMWQGEKFLTESAGACRLLGRRGLLLTRHRGHVPATLPPGVIHVDYAPFSQLLPRSPPSSTTAGSARPPRRWPPASRNSSCPWPTTSPTTPEGWSGSASPRRSRPRNTKRRAWRRRYGRCWNPGT